MANKRPYHEQVAQQIIQTLEEGTAPWLKPWKPGEFSMPHNPVSGVRYKGANAVLLASLNYDDPRWLTYKQATSMNAQVRRGEKGTRVQYWKFKEQVALKDEQGHPKVNEHGEVLMKTIELDQPKVFSAVVFNAKQVDGMPELARTVPSWDVHERAEQILKHSGVEIHHGGQRAFYRPSSDSITLPAKDQFETADRYYATALHELGHATGHESRLNRDLSHPFGSVGYAKEELRAEIASMMLGDVLHLGHDPGQHAAYVQSWIQVLKDDPHEILRAARDAEKIMTFSLSLEQQKDQALTQAHSISPIKETMTMQSVKPSLSFSHNDPHDAFASACSSMGLVLNQRPEMDGQMHRVRVEGDKGAQLSGAYVGYLDGQVPAGFIQNWKTGEKRNWKHEGVELSDEAKQRLQIQAEKKRQEREQEKLDAQRLVAHRCEEAWSAMKPASLENHYLRQKNVSSHGLKEDLHGNLVVPVKDVEGTLWSLQTINKDSSKYFKKNGRKSGCFHTIGDIQSSRQIIIVEGYATGASVHAATQKPVVVAFDAYNLHSVCHAIAGAYPKKALIIAGDNDHQSKDNVGAQKATAVAKSLPQARVVLPRFNADERARGLTDFNDLAQSRGLSVVDLQLAPAFVRKVERAEPSLSLTRER